MIAAQLRHLVNKSCERGEQACGCHASLWDRFYYAAQILFPRSGEDEWRLMADFATREAEEAYVGR